MGKSTLLNSLIGTKVAITSPKPQTTRLPIQGILHREDAQIVFVDTPGYFTGARSALTKKLNRFAEQGINGVDVILHIVDPMRPIGPEDKKLFSILRNVSAPKILVINKADMVRAPYREAFLGESDGYDSVIEVSAKDKTHLKKLESRIIELLPDGEPIYPFGQFTNMDPGMWVAEIIREKLFLRLHEEAPYALTVVVDEMVTRDDGTVFVAARILVSDERYRGIVIGKGGRGVKEIGQSARKELEGVWGSHVYIELTVEVDKHWMEKLSQN